MDANGSITAELCAVARAHHAHLEGRRVFADYLAKELLGEEKYATLLKQLGHEGMGNVVGDLVAPIVLARAAFTETRLAAFAQANGGPCQYVICGSGMDTFAFRNRNAAIEVFELDLPSTMKTKQERIRALGWDIPETYNAVPIDFATQDLAERLLASGFRRERPAFFSILGVTYYLSLDTFLHTVSRIAALAHSSVALAFDFPDDTSHERSRRLAEVTALLDEPMCPGFQVCRLNAALSKAGARILEYLAPADIQETFLDWSVGAHTAVENVHLLLAGWNC